MSASTAPAVKAALLTLLEADAGLAGVGFSYSDPGAAITQEAIFFGRTLETEKPAALGQRSQWESYDVEVYVYVTQDGDDPQACEERAWVLEGEIKGVVRANSGAQGTLTNQLTGGGWVVCGGTEMTPFTYNGARCCEALCRVHVEAKK